MLSQNIGGADVTVKKNPTTIKIILLKKRQFHQGREIIAICFHIL
jgi:hypothetical protein